MNERPRFLANLAEEDRTLRTPAHVERILRARVAAARKPSLWVWAWPAAAAVAFAALWMFLRVPANRPGALPMVTAQAEPAMPNVESVSTAPAAAVLESPAPAAPVATAAKQRLPRVSAPAQERITRRFYSLAYAPPEMLANSRMMRVRVPRAALLTFGLPLSAYQAQDEKVAADVIYTEDGIARAIRFIEQE
jgi:hypothetical protein